MAPRRTFGTEETATDARDRSPTQRRVSARVSFSTLARRPTSFFGRRVSGMSEGAVSDATERPAIPSALQPAEAYATPLPIIPMIVLSITMLGEFLSANVSAPFILFMVQGFNQFPDEATAGYWTGILVSTFFLTQFLTSLLWATVAAKHGTRIVLFISLLGSALTCCAFGTSTSFQQAAAIRLLQGIFAGAIGVARGCVTLITDQSNEGRAYAILGFCWGFGGVAGAIVGGTFESPANKWPSVFSDIPIFVQHPYLLPCAVASSITFTGSILCLFIGPDGGPREGAIRLPLEKSSDVISAIPEEETMPTTPVFEEPTRHSLFGTIKARVPARLSGYFASRVPEVPSTPRQQEQPVPLASTPSRSSLTNPNEGDAAPKQRTFSQTSRANGSAYGYGTYRSRLASRTTMALSLRRRRESTMTAHGDGMGTATSSDLNFAQRLLMANENAVTNIADLWVAAAMNVDNEDPFEDEDEFDEEGANDEAFAEGAPTDEDLLGDQASAAAPTPSLHNNRFSRRESYASTIRSSAKRPSFSHAGSMSTSSHPTPLGSPRHPRLSFSRRRSSQISSAYGGDEEAGHRRMSTIVPPIFARVGVRTPPAVLEAQQLLAQLDEQRPRDSLAPIMEGRGGVGLGIDHGSVVERIEEEEIKEPSLMSQLPVLIIIQYGLLALHSTTHDQVFYLYLVSKYPLGGLNLNAGHFSQLIALMCLAQIAYQFYLYPNIGPPRGRFSHLAMFRVGSLLFIPAYLSVVLYRVLASADTDGNPILMAALALSTAVRFCGSTFAYTAVSVLLNYMSPPHLVGLANGIAQSIVSLARFFGPILGGTLWSMSVEDGPAGYPLGFIACAGACALAIAHSFLIR
ncbi:hypothetical protein WOLCODRAFT_155919 [Wolfiporia cocos MD-104 SS10]|uniref:Major facilitator superfamily MFS-1 n=1 Tax=Wolfiporia cocos (strain MD-104) TaxID=742152 RepID=A0A2H3IZ72_WOLCO|nr:hypothetical protein WOLCODRAFT_155919 [Wolfiporia cocos MD-104 SS10]